MSYLRYSCLFGSSLPQLRVGELMSYLRYSCVFAYSGVQYIVFGFCFVLPVFVMFILYCQPVSQDCPCFIAPSVFSNIHLYTTTT